MKTTGKIWLITGVSRGLGRALTKQVIKSGDIVVGTIRTLLDRDTFETEFGQAGKAILLDLTDAKKIQPFVEQVYKEYGKIDVLVNNAGYGLFGMLEELDEEEVRAQMEVNFFAVWSLTKAVLPYMRMNNTGTIVQISSRLGLIAGAGNGLYAAGKFALEGLSEALKEETEPFGIRTILAEPGPIRTDFFGDSIKYARNTISAYKERVVDIRARGESMNGVQSGDPEKVAKAILDCVNMDDPPFRLPLTNSSLEALEKKAREYNTSVEEWGQVAKSVEFNK